MPTVTYYNGKFIDAHQAALPVEERGHQFGDGVYEVVRVYGGRPFLLDWHLERLERSLRLVQIKNPFLRDEWTGLIHDGIRRSGEAEATVYFHVTRGISPRNHVFPQIEPVVSMVVRAVTSNVAASSNPGLAIEPTIPSESLLAWPDERWANVFVKSINLLPNVIGKEAAHCHHAKESLLVRDGTITECSGSNAWFVRKGELWTHPANRYILGGITRRFVLKLAADLNIPVHEEALSLDELATADEVFITSTTSEITAIGKVVVHSSKLSSLYELPAAAPQSLVSAEGELQTLWRASSAAVVSFALLTAYRQSVQELRDGAFVSQ